MEDTLNYVALAMMIEKNWWDFVDFCGSEDEAEYQQDVIRHAAGMSPIKD